MEIVLKDSALMYPSLKEKVWLMLKIISILGKRVFNIFLYSDDDKVWDYVGYYLGVACSNLIFTMSI